MFFIIEEEKEAVLDFSKGTAKVFFFLIGIHSMQG